MANTYVKIASVSVGLLGASNMEFTSIPSTYTDLNLVISARCSRLQNFSDVGYQFNGITSGVYSYRWLRGSGSAATSGAASGIGNGYLGVFNAANSTASTFTNSAFYIPNYASSNNKSSSVDTVQENNATEAWAFLGANLYSQTTAVSSIKIYSLDGDNFVQHSTATLYGISKS
jgi:hypothetical protein